MNEEMVNSFLTNPAEHILIFWDIDSKIQSYIIKILDIVHERKIEKSIIQSIYEHLKILNKYSKTDEYLANSQSRGFLETPACENFYDYVVQIDDKIPYNHYPFGQIFYFSDKILIRVGENLNNMDNEIISELFRWFPISKSHNNQEIIVKREPKLNIMGNLKIIT